uniref:Proteasome assembly chaperone 1 n=1 Tax=Culex tarsalis TaxID=7177 RepID=A0A1Q3FXY9_CULTA
MSLNFGEIVEPSTRAFWDDYDEGEEELVPLAPLEWEWLNEDNTELKLDQLKHLLIIEGQSIAAFAGTAILKGKSPVCRLKNASVSVYHVAEQDVLVCLSEEKELNSFGRITEKLTGWLDLAQRVTAVSFHPSVMHKGTPAEDAEQVCFIRSVNGREKDLEAPNVITGLSAGALSYRKFREHSGPAAAYACYLDSSVIDSASAKPILSLFKALSIDCEDSYQLKFKAGSNLYL